MSEAKSSPALMDFLSYYTEREFSSFIFSDGYGSDRAMADGQAKQAAKFYNLLKDLIDA